MTQQFKLPPNFPKARRGSVIVKQITQGTLTTDAGIILNGTTAENVQKPNVGLIYAIGEAVGDDLSPGMKVYYNQYATLEILINGIPYVMMFDSDVYCILAEENYVSPMIKPAKEVRRGKKMEQQSSMRKRLNNHELNQKDKQTETNKKKK